MRLPSSSPVSSKSILDCFCREGARAVGPTAVSLHQYLFARVFLFFMRVRGRLERRFSRRFTTIDSAGVPVCFSDDGRGPAIVLLHGIVGDASDWNPAIRRLKDRFRLIALDARGQGASGKPHDPADYGRQMVGDVREILRHLGIEKVCVVGASAGAEIALRFTVEHPELVTRLVVIGSGWSGEKEAANYTRAGEILKEHRSLGPWIRETGGEGYFPTDPLGIAMADLLFKGRDIDACAATFLGMPEIIHLSKEEVESIQVPVLAICGEHDIERPCLERLVGVVPDVALKVLAGRGHMDMDEDPEQGRFVDEFLSKSL
jgi:pimeloyl-ACP methyl ester carboxylesterase